MIRLPLRILYFFEKNSNNNFISLNSNSTINKKNVMDKKSMINEKNIINKNTIIYNNSIADKNNIMNLNKNNKSIRLIRLIKNNKNKFLHFIKNNKNKSLHFIKNNKNKFLHFIKKNKNTGLINLNNNNSTDLNKRNLPKRPIIRILKRNRIKEALKNFLLRFFGLFLSSTKPFVTADENSKNYTSKYHSIDDHYFNGDECSKDLANFIHGAYKENGTLRNFSSKEVIDIVGNDYNITADNFTSSEENIEKYNKIKEAAIQKDGVYCFNPKIDNKDECYCSSIKIDRGTQKEMLLTLTSIGFNLYKRFMKRMEQIKLCRSILFYQYRKRIDPTVLWLTWLEPGPCIRNYKKYPLRLSPFVAVAFWEIYRVKQCLNLFKKNIKDIKIPFIVRYYTILCIAGLNLFCANANLEAVNYYNPEEHSVWYLLDGMARTFTLESLLEYITRFMVYGLNLPDDDKNNKSTLNNNNNTKGGMKRLDRFVTLRQNDSIRISQIDEISKLKVKFFAAKFIANYVENVKNIVIDEKNFRNK
uniref:Uncharacterized protein n=1 Tax=Nitzschia sp. PL3-2 TaxID=2083271 RepID=A0A2Z5Z9V7_9STRA|nr:hypothetical protein [Nitzschia sp. PL3-2]BBC77450.1 hypothetical protein [Nitzschia sp. PL3-2]